MRKTPATGHLWLSALYMFCLCIFLRQSGYGVAHAQPRASDYAVDNRSWNGLSRLQELASTLSVELKLPARLDLADVPRSDGILLIHPQVSLPVAALSEQIRRGGRVAVLDDLGTGSSLLEAFQIERLPTMLPDDALCLRGQRAWPIAVPGQRHPLTNGIHALVTNHPQRLVHRHLQPLFSLADGRRTLALVGAVGDGRLVSLSDASVVMNNMLAFNGNRRFAENLLRYLAGPNGGRVWLITNTTPLTGASQPPMSLAQYLRRWGQLNLPEPLIYGVAWFLAVGLSLSAMVVLPRWAAYGRVHERYFQGERTVEQPTLPQLLQFRRDFRQLLMTHVHADGDPSTADLVAAMAKHGVAEQTIAETRRLLSTLDSFSSRAGRKAPVRIPSPRFLRLTRAGRSILRALDSNPP